MRTRLALALAVLAIAVGVAAYLILADPAASSSESGPQSPPSAGQGRTADLRDVAPAPIASGAVSAAAPLGPDDAPNPGANGSTEVALVQVAVLGRGDLPLPGASVAASGTATHAGVTDSDGRFEFACTDDWTGGVEVLAEGYYPGSRSDVLAPAGDVTTLDFLLVPARELNVIVEDPAGARIPDVNVVVSSYVGPYVGGLHPEFSAHSRRAITDDRGEAILRPIAPASYKVRATHAQWFAPVKSVHAARETVPEPVVIVMEPASPLELRVIDADTSHPGADVVLSVRAQWNDGRKEELGAFRSDAEGVIRLSRPPGAEIRIGQPAVEFVELLDYATIPPELREYTIRIRRPGVLRCAVHRYDGVVVHACTIEYAENWNLQTVSLPALANAEGLIEVQNQGAACSPRFRILVAGYGASKWHRVRSRTRAPDPYPVTVGPEVLMTGRLVDGYGRGVSGATVELLGTSRAGEWAHRAADAVREAIIRTDGRGEFQVLLGPDSRYTLRFKASQLCAPLVLLATGDAARRNPLLPGLPAEQREIPAGCTEYDIGTITCQPPGTLDVVVPDERSIWVCVGAAPTERAVMETRVARVRADRIARFTALYPGLYRVEAQGGDLLLKPRGISPFGHPDLVEIQAGRHHVIEAP